MFIGTEGDPKTKAPEERNVLGESHHIPLLRSCGPFWSLWTINISSLRDGGWLETLSEQHAFEIETARLKN